MQNIICYVPMKFGKHLSKIEWGLIKTAKELTEKEPMNVFGIIVHCGQGISNIEELPFDAIYEIQIGMDEFPVAYYHIQIINQMIERINSGENLYLFSSNPLNYEIAAALSVQKKGSIISNVISISIESPSIVYKRGIYQDKAHEYISVEEDRQFVIMNSAYLYSEKLNGIPRKVERPNLSFSEERRVSLLFEKQLNRQELMLTEARCVIGIGRGVYKSKNLEKIIELAEILNAPIGGSKVADELGLIPRENRIGSSGISIEDVDIYIAIGISGSSQHLEGIKGVKHVIAINVDPAAPIFKRCDLGIVADYEYALPLLIEGLNQESEMHV